MQCASPVPAFAQSNHKLNVKQRRVNSESPDALRLLSVAGSDLADNSGGFLPQVDLGIAFDWAKRVTNAAYAAAGYGEFGYENRIETMAAFKFRRSSPMSPGGAVT
ncbi:MAG: hypothetical protein ACLQJR_13985 [Stellaceae bacterium]